jgi:hypothetical protein
MEEAFVGAWKNSQIRRIPIKREQKQLDPSEASG